MADKFARLLEKLKPYSGPSEYVSDPYSIKDAAEQVAASSEQLTPEDVHKILNAESTGGQNLQNPVSSASGPFQFVDKTRNELMNELKSAKNVEIPANPIRQDALLMQKMIEKSQNALNRSKIGEKEPNLENLYLMHHYGQKGGLDALNDPKSELSKEKFKNVRKLLSKKPLPIEKEGSAKDLLELLKD